MGIFSSDLSDRHVVIIGGSFAGVSAAMELQNAGLRVTIIEPRDGMFLNFAALRSMSTAGWEHRICIPYDRLFKKNPANKVVRGFAKSIDIDTNTVTYTPVNKDGQINNGEATISYDYLIVACGSSFNMPMGFPSNRFQLSDIRKDLRIMRERVRTAKKIVIVGGGASGIELAGEISDLPNKDITVVHAGSQLFSSSANRGVPKKLSDKILQECAKRNIKVLLNSRLAQTPSEDYLVSPGAYAIGAAADPEKASDDFFSLQLADDGKVEADLLIMSIGGKPVTGWIRDGNSTQLLKNALTESGYIKVNEYYQVQGISNVFSLGDAADSLDMKAAWAAGKSASIVASNITKAAKISINNEKKATSNGAVSPTNTPRVPFNSVDGKTLKLKTIKPGGHSGIMLVPLGKTAGAGVLPFGLVGSTVTSMIKGKTLFTAMYAGIAGYSVHEVVEYNEKVDKVLASASPSASLAKA